MSIAKARSDSGRKDFSSKNKVKYNDMFKALAEYECIQACGAHEVPRLLEEDHEVRDSVEKGERGHGLAAQVTRQAPMSEFAPR
jgi:hypothetical protein